VERTNSSGAVALIPPWLNGYDVLAYAHEAGLKFHPIDAAAYRWRIETVEQYERRPARLVEVLSVAVPGASPNWRVLETLPPSEVPPPLSVEVVAQKRRELIEQRPGDIVALLNWIGITITAAPDENIIDAVRGAYEALRDAAAPESGPFFPDLAVKFIRFDRALSKRAGLARVLLRVEEEPAILARRPQPKSDGLVFGSAWHLQSNLSLTRDAYLAPLFLCHAPWIWAATGARLQGVAVFELGKPAKGRSSDAAELLQLFMPPGPRTFNACPTVSSALTSTAISWWCERLDKLLSTLTNPAAYASSSGEYSPRRQFETLLSVEQLGNRIQGILAHQRDQPTRRTLAFGALDTLEGLGVVDFAQATKLSRAQKTLARLEELLPTDVAATLLPTARRAVEGLRGCQDQFFLDSRIAGDKIRVPDRNGPDRELPIEQAVAQYLRVLRNANHGFGGQDDAQRRRDEVLLMAHTGDIPDDVVLLPYLYWLEVLTDPSPLIRRLPPRK
jgi:hypothetical protein